MLLSDLSHKKAQADWLRRDLAETAFFMSEQRRELTDTARKKHHTKIKYTLYNKEFDTWSEDFKLLVKPLSARVVCQRFKSSDFNLWFQWFYNDRLSRRSFGSTLNFTSHSHPTIAWRVKRAFASETVKGHVTFDAMLTWNVLVLPFPSLPCKNNKDSPSVLFPLSSVDTVLVC